MNAPSETEFYRSQDAGEARACHPPLGVMPDARMSEINQLIALVRQFRDERDWAQFHNAKDLAAEASDQAEV